MSKKASRRRWRAFGSAFMLTLCLLILGAGCLVAEYNTRRTAFATPVYRWTIGYRTAR